MKNIINKLILITSVAIFASSPGLCEGSLLNIPSLFIELGLKPVVWAKLPNNEMAFVLRYGPLGDTSGAHSAYARLNNKGELMVGPIPIDNGGTLMIPETRNTVFSDNGVLCGYYNSGPELIGPIVRMSYDPKKMEWASVMFDDKESSSIISVSHLPNLGNVLINLPRGQVQGKYLNIMLDDMVSNRPRIIEIYDPDVWASQGTAVMELTKDKIIILYSGSVDGNLNDDFIVSKAVIDINTADVEAKERFNTKEFYRDSIFSFDLPFQEHGLAFRREDRIFFVAQGSYVGDLSHRKSIFLEIDKDGYFVEPEDRIPLQLDKSTISGIPQDWILLMDVHSSGKPEPHDNWILSLDDFPRLVFSKCNPDN